MAVSRKSEAPLSISIGEWGFFEAVVSSDDRSRAQISHVHLGSRLCVVEQVPADMVGILVDDIDIVIATVPAPVRTDGPVPSRHFKENPPGSQKR